MVSRDDCAELCPDSSHLVHVALGDCDRLRAPLRTVHTNEARNVVGTIELVNSVVVVIGVHERNCQLDGFIGVMREIYLTPYPRRGTV